MNHFLPDHDGSLSACSGPTFCSVTANTHFSLLLFRNRRKHDKSAAVRMWIRSVQTRRRRRVEGHKGKAGNQKEETEVRGQNHTAGTFSCWHQQSSCLFRWIRLTSNETESCTSNRMTVWGGASHFLPTSHTCTHTPISCWYLTLIPIVSWKNVDYRGGTAEHLSSSEAPPPRFQGPSINSVH